MATTACIDARIFGGGGGLGGAFSPRDPDEPNPRLFGLPLFLLGSEFGWFG